MHPSKPHLAVLSFLACGFLLTAAKPLSSDIPDRTDISDEVIRGNGLSRGNALDATVVVDTFQTGVNVPKTLFGVFFEEINHAGVGGLDPELVSNRGFEAGGQYTPSSIEPWRPIGSEPDLWLETQKASVFEGNPIALKFEARGAGDENGQLKQALGFSNPGYWGMNIEAGEEYNVTMWLKSEGSLNLTVAFLSQNGQWVLGEGHIVEFAENAATWQQRHVTIRASSTDHKGQLAITTRQPSTIWFDQISAKPVKTFKGHGMRVDLAEKLLSMKPGFIRFPGGCYVEGVRLLNAFRWRQSVGRWENRPGHLNDVWGYWSDDGLGLFEYLQLAEDIDAAPVWVFNNGLSHTSELDTKTIGPFIKDVLDGIEFARGPADSEWGSLRAEMGHPEPFDLEYMAIGNEDCGKRHYEGNYLRFYQAIKARYPFMKLISNCDATNMPLVNPADLFDYHIYTSAAALFALSNKFDGYDRSGPKVFASEYAVVGQDAGTGSLLAAVSEAGFMVGLERNSDVIEMASYAPLFVNTHDRTWNPDAIVFNSWQSYGTPSYWVQTMFNSSGGSLLIPALVQGVQGATANTLVASATKRVDVNQERYIVKAVNFGGPMNVQIQLSGLSEDALGPEVTVTTLTGGSIWDENSFSEPEKVVPVKSRVPLAGNDLLVWLPPMSVNLFEFPLAVAEARTEVHVEVQTEEHVEASFEKIAVV
ncbi:alpha-L-arabinofuranosidase [Klebsormidium nitens]|uniref:non-reducing end alpha-L-arabinofuranosidase n=1 Tax=Klebsormidium nitens TaxID=105231 RepID=A0A1Y1IGI8_KLENI|nr:alpha-L-arabinofuranosidase [Klebsormidium nitens]|eukprot:GAQ87827.1 alpha-L-arabinofuranosidase [Klebsormidium nitens]